MKAVIGKNIQAARRAKGFSQRQLAQTLEVDQFQVSRWERGLHRPADETLIRIAETLGVTLAWFYSDDDDPERTAA